MIDTVSTWTVEHLDGYRRLTHADAVRSETLRDQMARDLAHYQGKDEEPEICMCGNECRKGTLTHRCDKCNKREHMRRARSQGNAAPKVYTGSRNENRNRKRRDERLRLALLAAARGETRVIGTIEGMRRAKGAP
jgi:hypothetical protein